MCINKAWANDQPGAVDNRVALERRAALHDLPNLPPYETNRPNGVKARLRVYQPPPAQHHVKDGHAGGFL